MIKGEHQGFRVKVFGFEVEGSGPMGMTVAMVFGAAILGMWLVLPERVFDAVLRLVR